MYEFGTLRPPTDADMARRALPLERIRIEHHMFCFAPADAGERAELETYGGIDYGCRWDRHVEDVGAASVGNLLALCRDHAVPVGAVLTAIDYEGELGLDWSHLTLCECREWFAGSLEDHVASDYHVSIMLSRQWRPSQEQLARVRELFGEESGAA